MFAALLSGPWSIVARIVGALALVGAIWGHGFTKGLAYDEARRDKAEANSREYNVKIVRIYHEKIKVIYRNAHNVQPNLERLCGDWKLRGVGRTDGAPKAEAEHGATIEGLAAEVPDCLAENAQLNSLLDQLQPQVKRP